VSGEKVSELSEIVKDFCKNVTIVSNTRLLLEVDKERILEVAKKLIGLGFDHVKGVCGVDYPNSSKIEVIYYISSYSSKDYEKIIIELRISLPRDNPTTLSLTSVWPSCEYSERETYEMLGIKFEGHPRLKLLLLPEEFEGVYPLRKEYMIPEEGIEA
jgi:NADH-quinone oxidoreductase subunit C